MDRKSLLTGTVIGSMIGSILAGGIVFASTNTVSAQKENIDYNGIHGTALVYGGTTYGELYAVQQVLNQQGIVNQWSGSSLSMDTASKSNQQLTAQNQQLSQHAADLTTILQSLSKVPASAQQQVLTNLAQATSSGSNDSEQEDTAVHNFATGLQKAESEVQGNPGNASTVISNLLNQLASSQANQQSSQDGQSESDIQTSSASSSDTSTGSSDNANIGTTTTSNDHASAQSTADSSHAGTSGSHSNSSEGN